MNDRAAARADVMAWVSDELHHYADVKWAGVRDDHERRLYEEGIAPGSLWREQFDGKVHRAHLLGLDNPLGQQAMLKALVTVFELCVTMALRGPLPEPGHPSGELTTPEPVT